jgi:hypothetical protein
MITERVILTARCQLRASQQDQHPGRNVSGSGGTPRPLCTRLDNDPSRTSSDQPFSSQLADPSLGRRSAKAASSERSASVASRRPSPEVEIVTSGTQMPRASMPQRTATIWRA